MVTGIIPCAGSATRMNGIPKFLLPIEDESFHLLGRWHRLMLETVDELIIVTSPDFASLVSKNIDSKVKLMVAKTATMNETLNVARFASNERNIVMAMPDSYIPGDLEVIPELVNTLNNSETIAALALYKIREKQRGKLGQVERKNGNQITAIIDKDPFCNLEHAWGLAAWKNEFWKYIDSNDPHIGYAFSKYISENGQVTSRVGQGFYFDCGTFSEYREAIANE